MVIDGFWHSKAEMARWMLATVCKNSHEFHPIGACNVMIVGAEEDLMPGFLVAYLKV